MIAIIDYGMGNLASVKKAFDYIGCEAKITSDPDVVLSADGVILPGVGAVSFAMEALKAKGLDVAVKKVVENKTPLLGICLGMQMLFDKSYEYGEYDGLSLIPGKVKPIIAPKEFKIPHIGWNSLTFKNGKSPLFKYINEGDFVYFVHSFFADECEKNQIAVTDYSAPLTAAVQNKNVFGTQFHPEKSGDVGLNILKAFAQLKESDL